MSLTDALVNAGIDSISRSSYRGSLDERSDEELAAELERRARARASGVCDYCLRPLKHSDCRFPKRHHHPEIVR